MELNKGRIWLGGLAGGVVWIGWSFITGHLLIGTARYEAAHNSGMFLREPRYPFFLGQWILILFIVSIILAHLYAWTRSLLGPGPKTALKIGGMVGFAAGFPDNFAWATWSPIDRIFPLAWMLDMWVGAILVTLVAGALYKE